MRSFLPGFLLLFLAVGCARYEYDIVGPAELVTHIGAKDDTVITRDPLEYRFRSYEDRLIVQIHNPTEDPIQLLGPQSAAVDPKGQSHPLRGMTIESHSFIKLILPPPPPYIEPTGPTIGIGIGVSYRGKYDPTYPVRINRGDPYDRAYMYDPYYNQPRYLSINDENHMFYWNWTGQGEVRLAMTFERGGKTFRDEFVFKRVKLK